MAPIGTLVAGITLSEQRYRGQEPINGNISLIFRPNQSQQLELFGPLKLRIGNLPRPTRFSILSIY